MTKLCVNCGGRFLAIGRGAPQKLVCSDECRKKLKRDSNNRYRQSHLMQERERTRKWQRDNPERVKEKRSRYYSENRERMLAQAREYKMNNPEVIRRNTANQIARRSASVRIVRELQSKGLEALL